MRTALATILVLFALGAAHAYGNSSVLCRTSLEGGGAGGLEECLLVSEWQYDRPSCEGTITLINDCEMRLIVDGSELENGDTIQLATPATVTVDSAPGNRLANLRAADEQYPCTACSTLNATQLATITEILFVVILLFFLLRARRIGNGFL